MQPELFDDTPEPVTVWQRLMRAAIEAGLKRRASRTTPSTTAATDPSGCGITITENPTMSRQRDEQTNN
jgi:hypothetical protein